INDTYGHDVGDLVLKEFSRRLLDTKRKDDIVGRLSGDEFSVVMREISGITEVIQHLSVIKPLLNSPFIIPELNLEVMIRSSIGYSVFPEHADTVSGLFKIADNALYKEKKKRIKIA